MKRRTTSGKSDGWPPLKGSPAVKAAILLGGLLLVAVPVVLALTRPGQSPVTENPAAEINLPLAPPLPAVNRQQLPAAPPLTQTQVQPPPQESMIEAPATPAETVPQASGTITWKWLLYPVNPTVLGISVGQLMAGYQFAALGVTIANHSTVPVAVDNNAFTVTVDGRTYSSEVWSTGHAVIQGLPFLAPATVEPGGSISGFTGYMIPQQFRRGTANWRPAVPETVQVQRIDPPAPMFIPPAPAPGAGSPAADE